MSRLISDKMIFVHEENYDYSIVDQAAWVRKSIGVHNTSGSISTDRFFFDLDLKYHSDLTSHLTFQYRYHRTESFLWDELFHLADLTAGSGSIYAGITGMAESRKENNTFGFITGLKTESGCWITLRCIWPRLWFNMKGPDDEEFQRRPVEYLMEGLASGNRWMSYAKIDLSPEWRLMTSEGLKTHEETTGRGFVLLDLHPNHLALDWSFMRKFEKELPRRNDRFLYLKTILEWFQPLRFLDITLRTGPVIVDGESDDPEKPDGRIADPTHFLFYRREWLLSAQAARSLGKAGRAVCGLIGSHQSMDPGDSEHYTGYSGAVRLKLYSSYHHRFEKAGTMEAGISYNASETRFGGGYLKLNLSF